MPFLQVREQSNWRNLYRRWLLLLLLFITIIIIIIIIIIYLFCFGWVIGLYLCPLASECFLCEADIVLCIAAVPFVSDDDELRGTPLPRTSIGIELYYERCECAINFIFYYKVVFFGLHVTYFTIRYYYYYYYYYYFRLKPHPRLQYQLRASVKVNLMGPVFGAASPLVLRASTTPESSACMRL